MKVSVRVAHQARCANASKSAVSSAPTSRTRNGCTCRPTYYSFHRDSSGKVVKGERVHDRQTAERAAERLQRDLDAGRLGFLERKRVTLPQWVEEFETILAGSVRKGDLKPRSMREYMDSLRRASFAIGHVELRQITSADLRRFDDALEGVGPATRARHLKHLNLALEAARREQFIDINPVPDFRSALKLHKRIPRRGKAPFEEGELARLWPAFEQVRDGKTEPVYRYMAEFGVETGLRIGELAALDWTAAAGDLSSIRVDWTWNDTDGLILPKDREQRVVYLTGEARAVLEAWVRVVGVQETGPVFPSPRGGRLSIRNAQRRLDAAMIKAGIPKTHPEMRLPRSWHSLRYSTSVLLQRRGYHPRYIEQLLGHGSLELTYGVYGKWTPDQLAAEAAAPSYRPAAAAG
jgi:integrase